jgi:Fe-S cluster assembly protein SufD
MIATSETPAIDTLNTSGPDFANHPASFRAAQQAAWERFIALPMPKRGDETWRFADTRNLDISRFGRAEAVSDATQALLLKLSIGLAETSGQMVFANDRLLVRHFHGDALSTKGVIWLPLEQAIAEHPALVERFFMREEARLGSEKFAALHASQVRGGMFLYVPKGVEIALPVESHHWISGENASIFPHTLIVAEENAKVTVIDYFASASACPGFACGVNDISAASGAKVTYIAVQEWNRTSTAFHINSTTVGRDANVLALRLNLGGAMVRDEAVSRLRGPGGRSDMLSVNAAEGTQIFDQRTLQIHEAPNASSDLLYGRFLRDSSVSMKALTRQTRIRRFGTSFFPTMPRRTALLVSKSRPMMCDARTARRVVHWTRRKYSTSRVVESRVELRSNL